MRDPTKAKRAVRARRTTDRRRTIPDPAGDGSAATRASASEDAICAISDLLFGRYASKTVSRPTPREKS